MELALVVSGASGARLAIRFARRALRCREVRRLHVVVTAPAAAVLRREVGPRWAGAAAIREGLGEPERTAAWDDGDLEAPIASGSYRLGGVVVLPCSSGMAGALAHGISRGLGQRVADVALKQRWPLILGVRETPMSAILLENLLRLARAGAFVVPPVPAYYVGRGDAGDLERFEDHYCLRVLDLLGLEVPDGEALRWGP